MSRLTVETPSGVKGEFVYAFGLTYVQEQLNKIPNRDLRSHIERIKDLEIREDDVYLATFPKSGTHWVWEILVMLRRGTADYELSPKESVFLDFKDPEIIDKVPSPRVLNCHFPCKLTPKGIFEKKTKIVHVQRNPKDVFVSHYHHHKNFGNRPFCSTFQEFFPNCIGKYGICKYCLCENADQFYPWYKYVKEWERFSRTHPEQILNLSFEDLKEFPTSIERIIDEEEIILNSGFRVIGSSLRPQDPVREIKKIDKFLGTSRTDDLISKIAEACHFENLKKADAEIKVKDSVTNNMSRGSRMLKMYRKGQVGDWKNHFTVEQNEEMDEWLNENLVDTELKFRYTLD